MRRKKKSFISFRFQIALRDLLNNRPQESKTPTLNKELTLHSHLQYQAAESLMVSGAGPTKVPVRRAISPMKKKNYIYV